MKQLDIIIKKYDKHLLWLILILCGIGMVMLYSASSFKSLYQSSGLSDTIYLRSHLKRMIIGIIAMFFFTVTDYRKLKAVAPYLIILSILLLLMTKLIYVIRGSSAAARWLNLGFLSIQTSDIARFSLIIYLAFYIDKKRNQIKEFYSGIAPPLFIMAIILSLIVIQPDFSTAAILGLIGFIMLFIGGAKISHLAAASTGALTIMIPVMLMMPYRMKRIIYWVSSIFGGSDSATKSLGYQAQQSLISLGNGGILGLGPGNSLEKNLFLPEPHTDFIFAIIGEELGLWGAIGVLSIFLLFFQRGIKIAKETTDPFGIMLAIGIVLSMILYTFINVGYVTGILPVTGLPIPLISHGGSNLVITLSSLGILLNISESKRSIGEKIWGHSS
ncbi:MAG: putative peptidoglycan glycosyltransferase FtsW [Candidatus Neomarinimicrobiota bacterium]|nr:putative peptidoglycan glycosyltransferase FtsW [Candidatus Neomarinimicrobiota bacterium]